MVEIINNEKNWYTRFVIKDDNKIVSSAKVFDYHREGFDWVLITDVDTKKPYMRLGYGTQVMNAAYNYVQKKFDGKIGVYLLVETNNADAIRFYRKLNYNMVKSTQIKNTSYYVLAKGNADTNQLKNVKFGN